MTDSLLDRVREACRRVAEKSVHVRINYASIPAYIRSLPDPKAIRPQLDPACHYLGRQKDTVAFLLTLDTINFGSGFFPHMRKRQSMSGYFTVAAALNDAYHQHGPFSAEQLAAITPQRCTQIFDQDPADSIMQELMRHFARALNDLGRYLLTRFDGTFTSLVEAAGSSAARLVHLLSQMRSFHDVRLYEGLEVPFYKRAQIAAADLAIAFEGQRWGRFDDLQDLTIFADNVVPHVLWLDGILLYEPQLIEHIATGMLLPAGSTEEVEIRACAVHAVELIKKQIHQTGQVVSSWQLDNLLWNRGRQPRYKAVARHRTRTVFY